MPNEGGATRAARQPGAVLNSRSQSDDGVGFVNQTGLQAMIRDQLEMDSHVIPLDDDAGLLAANPTTPNTIALYAVNMSAGRCRVGGTFLRAAAAADQALIGGAPDDIPSYKLDGTAAAVLSADGKTYWCTIVAVVVSGAVELRAVFGDEADDASEVEPSAGDVDDALRAAVAAGSEPDLDPSCWLTLSAIKVQRQAVDTIVMTHVDPAADDDLADERGRGYSFDPDA